MLSTGCKSALLVHSTSSIVNLVECGVNAISAILSYCQDGYGFFVPRLGYFDFTDGADVNISIDGHIYTKVDEAIGYLATCI